MKTEYLVTYVFPDRSGSERFDTYLASKIFLNHLCVELRERKLTSGYSFRIYEDRGSRYNLKELDVVCGW